MDKFCLHSVKFRCSLLSYTLSDFLDCWPYICVVKMMLPNDIICCCLMLIQRRGGSRGADPNGSVYAGAIHFPAQCSNHLTLHRYSSFRHQPWIGCTIVSLRKQQPCQKAMIWSGHRSTNVRHPSSFTPVVCKALTVQPASM